MIQPNKYGIFERHTELLQHRTEKNSYASIILVETKQGWHYGMEWNVSSSGGGGFYPSVRKPPFETKKDAVCVAARKIKLALLSPKPHNITSQEASDIQELVFWCDQQLQLDMFA